MRRIPLEQDFPTSADEWRETWVEWLLLVAVIGGAIGCIVVATMGLIRLAFWLIR